MVGFVLERTRIKLKHMPRNNSKSRKGQRREEAIERQGQYDKLSNAEKLADLNKVFGKKGAKRQRERLKD